MKQAEAKTKEMTRSVLIVDDEDLGREFLTAAMIDEGWKVLSAANGEEALDVFCKETPDLVVSDIRMPNMTGLQLLKQIKEESPETPVVLLTAYGTLDWAVEALRQGAFDFLVKPLELSDLHRVLERIPGIGTPCEGQEGSHDAIIGKSPELSRVLSVAREVASVKAPVLVQGESGTGKELVARLIHEAGPRRERDFVRVNCAALSSTLLESELFGHEKGAFTGAVKERVGRFELADGGTLLLDEIGEFPYELQAKVLRVLEQEEFERVGGVKTLKVDVHVIAVTNRDLEREVQEGRFRADLFYRLNVVPLRLPPLRDRKTDIPALVSHFLSTYSPASRPTPTMSDQGLKGLMDYSWPGNIRELQNFVRRLLVLNRSVVINSASVRQTLEFQGKVADVGDGRSSNTLREMERDAILKALSDTGNNRTRAAKILGLSTRTLFNKIKSYEEEGWVNHGSNQ